MGQCTVPLPNSGFVAVAGGAVQSLGLKFDGSIVTWGCGDEPYYNSGLCDAPAPNSDFVAIAAGGYHSLGLKSNGSIVAWGCGDYCNNGGCEDSSNYGQCTVPSPNADFIAIAAGLFHSVGLKSDGSIVTWGCARLTTCSIFERCPCAYPPSIPLPHADFIDVGANAGIRGSKADYDDDGQIDTTDYAILSNMIGDEGGGPSVRPTIRFWYLFDMDNDRDVDLTDFAQFANAFTGG